jgi:hypothetical protein
VTFAGARVDALHPFFIGRRESASASAGHADRRSGVRPVGPLGDGAQEHVRQLGLARRQGHLGLVASRRTSGRIVDQRDQARARPGRGGAAQLAGDRRGVGAALARVDEDARRKYGPDEKTWTPMQVRAYLLDLDAARLDPGWVVTT